ncbi:MAG TPA: homoserine O-acetyltransferase [Glutamicibacter sp.]|uniref:Homoserine O-acetyltransferase n=1 Tax=Glutamicibacter arilaitensis (strain DSM 16368 / CIP 108037 / IAM 15318 / JCM 13566 / NCIMB 14258 / Re117) TaxID=861360 RepID=A0ABP1U1A1_GLUAR|nr:homoserine O-acetyltransferase [Glutamicibacter sp.]CBT75138.1 homoserine O-acetyltransferase [Glutamicibacter arilaitensis Re117]HCH47216.1 homoserine O-acetyltransferase [Glutamicibacter sp.]
MASIVTTEDTLRAEELAGGQDGILRRSSVGEHRFEFGGYLPEVELGFETWGTLAADGSNAVLVMHALTGDAHVAQGDSQSDGWWEGFVGPGATIDTNEYFVVSINMVGGCNGSTGPASLDEQAVPYGSRFPFVTIKDSVRLEARLAKQLGIDSWHAVIGGSMGGARALEYAVQFPQQVKNLVVMASSAQATAEQIAFAQVQTQSIRLDPHFCNGDYYGNEARPDAGLGLARRLAHITYRSEAELETRFSRNPQEGEKPTGQLDGARGRYQVESYLDHQASKLVNRFDANSYLVLTEALMSHDVARGHESLEAALARLAKVNVVVAAVTSDRLYFPVQSVKLASSLAKPKPVHYIDSPIGHDGFLTDAKQLDGVLRTLVFGD